MSKHDYFLDDYIGYRIFEDSMKNAGKKYPSGKPTSPPPFRLTKPSSDLGCGGWITLICMAIVAISIFGSCGKSSSKSYSFGSYKRSYSTSSHTYSNSNLYSGSACSSSLSDSKSNPSASSEIYSSSSKTKSNFDPYDAKSYAHPEDLYYDYPDDFWDYEDAEEYWDEHN